MKYPTSSASLWAKPLATPASNPVAPIRRANHWRSGSTLVEMVITVGLLVSVLVPLVGLLTMGMETSLKAGVNTIGSRITNQLMGELQQADWQDLDGWNGRTMYFDDQGLAMPDSTLDRAAAFMAQVYISTPGVNLATHNANANNATQRKVTTVVSPANGERSIKLLADTLSALEAGKATPTTVRVGHGLVTKTGKDI
ncbi:hypothetical protein FEM03_21815 [Phragmitibacter flavus]|uniref:Verru_Chthon cassette protein B n=1 Tax=Phragmitibacter flavus TaxID=2576071 RepID=A0A5R8KAJ9_9BACT|nr:hypothetical protein [Phragmitibacter flavus]TLD68559.1 hypothetical protein FEM03_21815 [Phragmitibacter flavus]